MAQWLPEHWSLPQLLLAVLVLTVALTGVVAASTSQSAFGAYNAGWDGASELRDIASEEGAEPVVALNTSSYVEATPNATIAVLLSPDEPYSLQDRTRLARFVEEGGTLVVAEDYGTESTPILQALGVETRIDGTPLRDEQEHYRSPAFPVASKGSDAPATEGVDALTLNHGTSLRTNNSTVLVSSGEFSYLDTNYNRTLDESEELESRPVVVRERVGEGTVYVVADPSIFINAMLERPGNERFVRNLVADHETLLLDYSHRSGTPPLVLAMLTLQEEPFWQVVLAMAGLGTIGWSRGLRRRGASLWTRVSQRDQADPGYPLAAADPEEIVEYLARQHPEWDEPRLRHVMRGVIRDDESRRNND